MSKFLIELRGTDPARARQRVGIEFPVRIRIISRTPKAVLAELLRKRRHGCYVPKLWIPRSAVPEVIANDVNIVIVTIPSWLWEKNARPDPEK